MSIVRARLKSRRGRLIADQRGAVAFEMPFVYLVVIMVMLIPLADVAIAGFQYIAAWQALRAFGQSIQYSPPPDVTNASSWASSATAKADSRYPISNLQIICADNNVCTSTNAALPGAKHFSYSTTITLGPMSPPTKAVLCASTNLNPCTYTLSYSERFQ